MKKGELLAHETIDDFICRVSALTGHTSDIERFLAAHPDLAVIASRELGSTREIVVDQRDSAVAIPSSHPTPLTASPCSFQDAFAYLIQENDQ